MGKYSAPPRTPLRCRNNGRRCCLSKAVRFGKHFSGSRILSSERRTHTCRSIPYGTRRVGVTRAGISGKKILGEIVDPARMTACAGMGKGKRAEGVRGAAPADDELNVAAKLYTFTVSM
jgi:hypothetical protein